MKFVAGSVPRYLRQTKLGHLPTTCVIGSHATRNADGATFAYDVIMLPAPQFQRMRSQVGLQHVVSPTLKAGPAVNPAFVIADAKEVVVPEGEADPEAYARRYFQQLFKLVTA